MPLWGIAVFLLYAMHKVSVQRRVNEDSGEVELYCHSSQREGKERGIDERFAIAYEAALSKLAEGLHKTRTVKHYDKVLERLGRLKEKYAGERVSH